MSESSYPKDREDDVRIESVAPENVTLRDRALTLNWRRVFIAVFGIAVFVAIHLSPPWPSATDPMGKEFVLSQSDFRQ